MAFPHTRRAPATLRGRRARVGYAFLAPAAAVVASVTLGPILYAVFLSLSQVRLTGEGFATTWAGLANYAILYRAPEFWQALAFTAGYTGATVLVEVALGLVVALVLNGLVRGRGLAMAVLLLPWSLITVVSAEVWSYLDNGAYGLIDYVLVVLHVTSQPVNWLGEPTLALVAVGLADVWKTTPFVALILLAGLQMIRRDLYEAATLDGAGPWKSFWRVTFPLLRPSLLVAVLFRVLQSFGLFDLPFVLTSGGPGTTTQSLALLAYRAMFNDLEFGPGTAVSVVTVAAVVLVAVLFIRGLGVRLGEAGDGAA
ncbi:MAG: sugar ABC transporter permease [Firmicutes bacterium]|nr:sugar ABC transporter permease [Bacillota bacterium]